MLPLYVHSKKFLLYFTIGHKNNDLKLNFVLTLLKETSEFLAIRVRQARRGTGHGGYLKVLLSYFTIQHIYTDF